MRVLIWVSKGFLEDLARVSTQDEKNVDQMDVVTEAADVEQALVDGKVDILLIGAGRLSEWTRIWRSGVIETAPTFCPIFISALPISDARLLEVSEVGISDVADLTMSRDEIGQRLLDGYKGLRQRFPSPRLAMEKRLHDSAFLRIISDETDRRILSLIAQGKFDKEISTELCLSLQTIRNRISRILNEVGARNRTHLALLITESRGKCCSDDSLTHQEVDHGPDNQVA